MVRNLESLLLFSENAKKLAAFYEEKVGLKQTMNAEVGENGDQLFGFEFSQGPGLYIMDHSKVKGKSNQAERIIFNLETDDIEGDFQKLKDGGIKIIQEIYHMQDYGYIATFADPDGNYFQLVQVRPPESES